MKIRKIRKDDINRGLVETYKEHWPITNIDESLFDKVVDNDNLIFVAEDKGEIIGSIILHLQQKFIRDGGLASFIEEVIVRKEYRGKGIGEMLVSKAIEKAKELGCYKVILQCSDENVKFYEKCGLSKFKYNVMGLSL